MTYLRSYIDDNSSNDEAVGYMNFSSTLLHATSGTVFAVALSMEMMLGIATNLFIIIFSLFYVKSLKKSANLFLFGLSLSNLCVCILVMPFPIITASFQEWVFGETIEDKEMSCHISGYLARCFSRTNIYMLALISVERCLFITKPFVHKKYMQPTWSCSILVAVWLIIALISTGPFYGFGYYTFSPILCLCAPATDSLSVYSGFTFVVYAIPIAIIVITTLRTATFIQMFLRMMKRRSIDDIGPQIAQPSQQKSYSKLIRNSRSLFALLLVIQIVVFLPGFVLYAADAITSSIVVCIVNIFLYANNIINPILQALFRQDLRDFVWDLKTRVLCTCTRKKEENTKAVQRAEIFV